MGDASTMRAMAQTRRRAAGRSCERTATSDFGVSRRFSHDSSAFYDRFPAPRLSDDATVVAPAVVDRLWVGDARDLDTGGEVADNSVALVVTSPPYYAGKQYETEIGEGGVPASYRDYLQMLHDVFAACVPKLEAGGRIAVNVANLGRRPYRSLSTDVTRILQDDLGLLLRAEVIWRKAAAAGGNFAWGSFAMPSNPVLRDVTERVIIASKGRLDRAIHHTDRSEAGLPHLATIDADEYMEATTDVWDIRPESATRVGHPAPFPVELPRRLIDLYTWAGDLVLDPFMGSGTTAVAAVRTGRHYTGCDTDSSYIEAARERIQAEREAHPAEPAAGRESARRVARRLLEEHGWRNITERVTIAAGVEVAFAATDAADNRWLFDIAGAYSTTGSGGLRHTDTLWRCLGKATVLRHTGIEPLVLLTVDIPTPRSSAGRALAAATGLQRPVRHVVVLDNPDDQALLARLAAAAGPAG